MPPGQGRQVNSNNTSQPNHIPFKSGSQLKAYQSLSQRRLVYRWNCLHVPKGFGISHRLKSCAPKQKYIIFFGALEINISTM